MKAKIALVVFLLFLFYFSFAKPTFAADLVINEFSSASNPEWVEFYNSGEQVYSLQGVVLFFDGSSSTTQKLSFCDVDEIPAKSYKLITRPLNSYWLSNSGDTLILKKEDDIVDSISYGSGQPLSAPTSLQSISRIPDGGSWAISNNPSPQGNEASFVCPTPTPTPTPTLIPTFTSTPTSKPTNTSTPTKTPTPTPKPSTPTPSLTQSSKIKSATLSSTNLTSILGESTESAVATPSAGTTDSNKEVKTLGSSQNNIFKIFIGVGGFFIISCAILLFRYYKNKKINNE